MIDLEKVEGYRNIRANVKGTALNISKYFLGFCISFLVRGFLRRAKFSNIRISLHGCKKSVKYTGKIFCIFTLRNNYFFPVECYSSLFVVIVK